jgi:hypothetical protein
MLNKNTRLMLMLAPIIASSLGAQSLNINDVKSKSVIEEVYSTNQFQTISTKADGSALGLCKRIYRRYTKHTRRLSFISYPTIQEYNLLLKIVTSLFLVTICAVFFLPPLVKYAKGIANNNSMANSAWKNFLSSLRPVRSGSTRLKRKLTGQVEKYDKRDIARKADEPDTSSSRSMSTQSTDSTEPVTTNSAEVVLWHPQGTNNYRDTGRPIQNYTLPGSAFFGAINGLTLKATRALGKLLISTVKFAKYVIQLPKALVVSSVDISSYAIRIILDIVRTPNKKKLDIQSFEDPYELRRRFNNTLATPGDPYGGYGKLQKRLTYSNKVRDQLLASPGQNKIVGFLKRYSSWQ